MRVEAPDPCCHILTLYVVPGSSKSTFVAEDGAKMLLFFLPDTGACLFLLSSVFRLCARAMYQGIPEQLRRVICGVRLLCCFLFSSHVRTIDDVLLL